jgi:hypothetical protein
MGVTWHERCSLAVWKELQMNRTTLGALVASVALAAPLPAQAGVGITVVYNDDRGRYEDYRYRNQASRIAFDHGYRDGLREGEKDDRHDDRFEYRDEGRYRDGDSGYKREYGPRSAYISAYRRGFIDGYRRGYANVPSHDRYDDRGGRDDRYDRYDRSPR